VTLCSWEGNRTSGIALAMRHRLSGLPTYRLNGLRKGNEHPAYALYGVRPLYLCLYFCHWNKREEKLFDACEDR